MYMGKRSVCMCGEVGGGGVGGREPVQCDDVMHARAGEHVGWEKLVSCFTGNPIYA